MNGSIHGKGNKEEQRKRKRATCSKLKQNNAVSISQKRDGTRQSSSSGTNERTFSKIPGGTL